jgi:pimeloyl-ACP methyl ester carboxylesterase
VIALAVLGAVAAFAVVTTWCRERRGRAAWPPSSFAGSGGTTHYVRAGQGSTVVFVHGNIGDHAVFTHGLFDAACERYDCIAIDRPGHGYSRRPRGRSQGRPSVQARRLRATLLELGAERPVLVCHSWGAYVGLAFARDYPDDLAGLVLLAPVAFVEPGAGVPLELRVVTLVPAVGQIVWRAIAAVARPFFRAALDAVFWPEPADPRFAARIVAFDFESPKQVRASTLDVIGAARDVPVLSARYGEIEIPTAIVAGGEDWVAPIERHAEPLDDLLPSSTLEILPEAGHMIPVAHPDAALHAIDSVCMAIEAGTSR